MQQLHKELMCTIAQLTGSGDVKMHGALGLARFKQLAILRRLKEIQELFTRQCLTTTVRGLWGQAQL